MDELERLRERVEALERENARLRNPAQALWSERDLVWNQIERTMGFGTWTWDVATQKVDWSPNLFAILGYDPEQTPVAEAAKLFDEAIHPEDLQVYLAAQERALGGDTSQPARFRYVRPLDGRTIHVMLLYTPVQEGEPAPKFAGSILDVTEEVRAEGERLRAGRLQAVGRLAGSVAHDFNNLLAVIMGNTEFLLMSEPQNEALLDVLSAVRAGASLTGQLLSFTKHREGATQTLALDRLVEDTAPLLKRLLREDIQVELALAAEGSIKVDPGQFQNALVNLAVNARHAMPMGGRLLLRTSLGQLPDSAETAPALILAVEDSGIGMDPETLARLFEPFFTTKNQAQGPSGTGLGLVSVQSFVRRAGGDVRVRSQPNQGTCFELFFPRAERATARAQVPPGSDLAPLELAGEEILVVEDAPNVRRVLIAGLERAGLAGVHSFAGTEEALAKWPELQDRVRILITDVVMPKRSGRELALLLRRERPDLGVVFVTGYDPEGTALERSVVLGKPYTLAQLLDALRRVSADEGAVAERSREE